MKKVIIMVLIETGFVLLNLCPHYSLDYKCGELSSQVVQAWGGQEQTGEIGELLLSEQKHLADGRTYYGLILDYPNADWVSKPIELKLTKDQSGERVYGSYTIYHYVDQGKKLSLAEDPQRMRCACPY